jgi:RNA polymerase sigma-70 factor (ECF subfamily)
MGTTVDSTEWLADRFEENRRHLRAVAFRMLGSAAEADDAVAESWLRLSRHPQDRAGTADNLTGWLTMVVAGVALTMLKSRSREQSLEVLHAPEPVGPESVGSVAVGLEAAEAEAIGSEAIGSEYEALLADSVGFALLMALETLQPAERLAFVLHDLFAVPFDDIADIVDESPATARRLAGEARRRVHGVGARPS